MKSIKLHSKYGVNPTVPICFWCGSTKGEVVLLGAAYKGEAPPKMLVNYDPCKTCEEKFNMGVFLFEATEQPNFENQPAFICRRGQEIYPTGLMAVITKDASMEIFNEAPRKLALYPDAWDKVCLPRENVDPF